MEGPDETLALVFDILLPGLLSLTDEDLEKYKKVDKGGKWTVSWLRIESCAADLYILQVKKQIINLIPRVSLPLQRDPGNKIDKLSVPLTVITIFLSFNV